MNRLLMPGKLSERGSLNAKDAVLQVGILPAQGGTAVN